MAPARIPRTFHFVFGLKRRPERFHIVHYLCLASCLEVNEPTEIKLHVGRAPRGAWWKRIRDRITVVEAKPGVEARQLAYGDRFTRRFRYAHESDFVRLDVLIREGGIYADIDTLFVRPYPPELLEHDFVIGREPDIVDGNGVVRPSLCNAVLMSTPGSRFARTWRERMAGAFDGSWSRHSTLLPEQLSRELRDAVHVEPQSSFFHFPWTREGIGDLFERNAVMPAGLYSIHLWAHLWWSRRRRDFSDFHAGKLDEEYVRHADSSYALAARRFLPSR